MSTDISSLVVQRYYIDKLREEIKNGNKELIERINTLQRQCSHPTFKTDSKYYEGGYEYVSSVRITKTCTICEKILESYNDPQHRGSHA